MSGEYDTPDVARENYDAIEQDRKEVEEDRYTASEIEEMKEEAKNEKYYWDAKHGLI